MAAEAKCHQAIQLLSRSGASDDDVSKAAGLIDQSNLGLDRDANKDDDFSSDIVSRENALRARLWDTTAQPAKIKDPFGAAYGLWAGPFDGVLKATADALDPMEYVHRDLRAVRLALLAEYLSVPSGGPALEDVIKALQDSSWDGVRKARALVAEALDGVTADQVRQALRDKADRKVEIVRSHDKPDALDSVTLSLCFTDANLNGASARRKFCPQWVFGHADRSTRQLYRAEAWEVRHFFPVLTKKTTYKVEVAVPDIATSSESEKAVEHDGDVADHETQPANDKKEYPGVLFRKTFDFEVEARASAPGRRFWLELMRTAVLMVMGAVVLQKSAQAVLANAGIWTTALGILALGFTIDTLKSGIDGIRSKL
jgi:hypothetical protein